MHTIPVAPLMGVRNLGSEVFDYLPLPGEAPPEVGALVLVPFGRRNVDGVVVGPPARSDIPEARLRRIIAVGRERIEPPMMELAQALARHYLAPLGACLQAVTPPHHLPSRPRPAERLVSWAVATGSPPVRPLTARQAEVLAAVGPAGRQVTDLCEESGVSRAVVDALVARGAIVIERRPPLGEGEGGPTVPPPEDPSGGAGSSSLHAAVEAPRLSDEQRSAVDVLLEALDAGKPSEHLLWGVTGSGKTEVYLHLLRRVLERGGGAIVLVPEIALTVQLIGRVRARLGQTVAVIHSGLTPQRRAREWDRVIAGDARVVVGARSAVFAPVKDLRAIILDESHDSSYKQEEEPRYDARWVARWRCNALGAVLVEGTATPTVESLRRDAPPLFLRSRPTGARLPEVEVLDMRRQAAGGVLAPRAVAALRETLVAGEQAVVLLNRRGYAAYLLCEECGDVVMCPDCEVSLTYHRGARALVCHHCGLRTPVPPVCPACSAAALRRGAPGTERVVDELLTMVPRERLFRLDSDVVTSGSRVTEILEGFRDTTPAVLVGTQMVAKGHDYPLVTLVLVADADTGLYVPDFRATERTFQLLTQVAGRAGRAAAPGRVLLQTWNPEVPCIRMAVAREDRRFYQEELSARERLAYPPYRALTRIVVSGPREDRVDAAGRHLGGQLRLFLDDVRGPARLPRVRGADRRQLVVTDPDPDRARAVVGEALQRYRTPYARRGLDIMVDVDPQWFN